MAQSRARFGLKDVEILVADDNPQSLDIISSILMGFGVNRSVRAEDGEEAWRHVQRQAFEFVILDIEMPGLSGLDVLRKLRSDPRGPNYTTPVMMLSGATPRSKVEACRDTGAHYVLTKPLSPAVLLERMLWTARTTRAFVESDVYVGPDRRYHNEPLPDDQPERRAALRRLVADPARELSQSEVDALFA